VADRLVTHTCERAPARQIQVGRPVDHRQRRDATPRGSTRSARRQAGDAVDERLAAARRPADPGAAIYFSFRGKATVLACDTYTAVADNIAALAAHLDALRAIERYGVGSLEQALAGYKALPADSAADWRAVFGFARSSSPSLAEIDKAFKAAARTKHPDVGGTEIEMAHLNRARDYALQEIGG
jgi:hypothetical protein